MAPPEELDPLPDLPAPEELELPPDLPPPAELEPLPDLPPPEEPELLPEWPLPEEPKLSSLHSKNHVATEMSIMSTIFFIIASFQHRFEYRRKFGRISATLQTNPKLGRDLKVERQNVGILGALPVVC